MRTSFLVTTLLLIIVTICYYFIKIAQNKKTYCHINNDVKKERDYKLKEMYIKYRRCYYFNNIISFNNLVIDNISLVERSYENNLIYDVTYETPHGAKSLSIFLLKY